MYLVLFPVTFSVSPLLCYRSGPNLAVGREDPHQWMQQQGKAVQAYNGPGRTGTYHGARTVVGRGYPSPSGAGYPSPGVGGYPSASPGHPQHHPYSAATLPYRSASPHNYPQSPRHRNMVLRYDAASVFSSFFHFNLQASLAYMKGGKIPSDAPSERKAEVFL